MQTREMQNLRQIIRFQILCKTQVFCDMPPARGGNSDGLHVTQVAADESDRHSANSGLDGMQKRNGCVPQTDMPRTDAASAEVSSASVYQAPPAGIHFVKEFSSSSGLKSRETGNNLRFSSYSGVSWRSLLFGRVATYWAELMRRTLAPLRRIVSRELEVYAYGRISAHPQSFVVHDRMECGHVHTSLLWDIFDLLNGYTESPHVRAIRHRCQECLTLTAKKPVQSVAAVAKAA